MRRAALILLFVAMATLSTGVSAGGIRTIDVIGPRITLGQIMAQLSGEVAELDLGPAPRPNGSRLIQGKEIEKALDEAGFIDVKRIPAAIRVRRKMETLNAKKVEELVEKNLLIKKGVTLQKLRARASTRVPAGYETVTATVPKVPRRAGSWSTSVSLNFYVGTERIARISVPATFDVSAEAAKPDVKKGSPVLLLVRAGQIEVRIKATAGAPADVGDKLPVTLRPSGRVVQARLVTKDRAIAL